jgi:hypothetical protein
MRVWHRGIPVLVLSLALVCLGALAARAQTAKPASKEPPTAHVMLVRVAPGKQLEYLKWQADNDAISKEAGLPIGAVYVHTNGDSWDYMQITPNLTREQQAKFDELAQRHGRKTGFAAGLEFRTFAAWHSDTETVGPLSAAEVVAMAGK